MNSERSVIFRNFEVSPGNAGAKPQPNDQAQYHQKSSGDEGTNASDVVDPFADTKADDVQYN
jgi:hypothetical protein